VKRELQKTKLIEKRSKKESTIELLQGLNGLDEGVPRLLEVLGGRLVVLVFLGAQLGSLHLGFLDVGDFGLSFFW
jgi:hypothetical protein